MPVAEGDGLDEQDVLVDRAESGEDSRGAHAPGQGEIAAETLLDLVDDCGQGCVTAASTTSASHCLL